MTYAEAVQFLYELRMFGAKFGLENTFKLAALAGNPQEKLRFIHVAGTNGKGSTCAILESIYRAAGMRVGLFTSPHLVSFAERIQINRQLIAENEIIRLVEAMQRLLKHFPADAPPTFFEAVTVMALTYFAEQKCDLVIWETGMGGRLDATNIVTPLASVITNVEFDHQKYLGNSLAEIAFEKAGIIKPGVPVVTAANRPEALEVILKTAREKNAPLTRVSSAETKAPPLDAIKLPLAGEHQKLNAALALATVRALQNVVPISDKSIRNGLSEANWPGRFQKIRRQGQVIVLDGAHNPSGAIALREALNQEFPEKKPTILLGVLQDKDPAAICERLGSLAEKFVVVPVSSERTSVPEELAGAIRKTNASAVVQIATSLSDALQAVASDPFVVITGSLYLVGEALELLQEKNNASGERGLNEWTAQK